MNIEVQVKKKRKKLKIGTRISVTMKLILPGLQNLVYPKINAGTVNSPACQWGDFRVQVNVLCGSGF